MSKKQIAIVIPVYKSNLGTNELISLNRALQVFTDYPIFIIGPDNMDYSQYSDPKFEFEKFDVTDFYSVSNHNRFLMSEKFYSRFLDYHYILYHQLDVFIFKDELKKFLELDYDYIGAPWLNSDLHYGNRVIQNSMSNIPLLVSLLNKKIFNKREHIIGNGGFSLRRPASFLRMLSKHPNIRTRWAHRNEDVFWSCVIPNNDRSFKIAPVETGLKFAFDMDPEECLDLNNGQLPFGCHGWYHPDNEDFWSSRIKQFYP